jgi:mono/diheme cytochrome c family protein/plastocyanin
MRKEWIARIVMIVLVTAAIAIPVGAWWFRSRGIVIHARMAETGGWTPGNLTTEVGQPLHLRLTSDDVMHSFAIGQSDGQPVDVIPGEVTEVTLTFDRPGKYTFYCTRWCSVNHWRMRGTIEVTGPETAAQVVTPPLYVTLGLDIDAEHHAEVVPVQKPSAWRGAQLSVGIPIEYQGQEYYRSHSPVELWSALREDPALSRLSDQEIWDLVALVWQSNTTPQGLRAGQKLYAANCAACHGETGAGDGVFADQLDQPANDEHTGMQTGEMTTRPTDFTDPEHMLAASPAHLQGKILRGGMGTGMPYWGPIFTEEQTWALVAYLWTFQFEPEERP